MHRRRWITRTRSISTPFLCGNEELVQRIEGDKLNKNVGKLKLSIESRCAQALAQVKSAWTDLRVETDRTTELATASFGADAWKG